MYMNWKKRQNERIHIRHILVKHKQHELVVRHHHHQQQKLFNTIKQQAILRKLHYIHSNRKCFKFTRG